MKLPRSKAGVRTGRSANSPSPGERADRFPAFRYRNYRLFYGGQLVSVTGTWMQTLAQSWLVLDLSGSALSLGLVNLFQFLPILLLGIGGGVVADRFSKRNVLLVTQSTAMVLATILAVLVATDRVELWHVYALALCLGISNAFDMPTRQAFVSELVDRPAMMNAIALNSTLFNTGRVVGPALAGVLLAAFGPAVCFGLNAASFLAVLVCLSQMRMTRPVATVSGSPLTRITEGLQYVRATPRIYLAIAMIGVVSVFGMNFNVWVPLLAVNELNLEADGFGVLMASNGVGSLLGALTLATLGRQPRPLVMYLGAAGLGGLELVLAFVGELSAPEVVVALVLVACGFAMSTTMALANTIVQTTAPDLLRGRVMSVYSTTFAGSAPFGALLAGALADVTDTAISIAVGGAITLSIAFMIASRARQRGLLGALVEERSALRRATDAPGQPAVVHTSAPPRAHG